LITLKAAASQRCIKFSCQKFAAFIRHSIKYFGDPVSTVVFAKNYFHLSPNIQKITILSKFVEI